MKQSDMTQSIEVYDPTWILTCESNATIITNNININDNYNCKIDSFIFLTFFYIYSLQVLYIETSCVS